MSANSKFFFLLLSSWVRGYQTFNNSWVINTFCFKLKTTFFCLTQAALVKVDLERPSFINIAVESMDLIFNKPKSIFIKMTGSEFIYNGVEIDCNQTAYAAKAACAEMRRNKLLKIMNAEKTRLRFRWFDSVHSHSKSMQVSFLC